MPEWCEKGVKYNSFSIYADETRSASWHHQCKNEFVAEWLAGKINAGLTALRARHAAEIERLDRQRRIACKVGDELGERLRTANSHLASLTRERDAALARVKELEAARAEKGGHDAGRSRELASDTSTPPSVRVGARWKGKYGNNTYEIREGRPWCLSGDMWSCDYPTLECFNSAIERGELVPVDDEGSKAT